MIVADFQRVALTALGLAIPSASVAVTIDKFFQIQPIQVCDSAGTTCASVPLATDFTQSVYAQAGVAVVTLPTTQVRDSALLSVSGVVEINQPGNGQSTDPLALNTWFVDNIDRGGNSTIFGEAYLSANGVVINGSAVEASGRTDSVAHEIGHNLGLGHYTYGAGAADNLMTSGGQRNSPADDLTQSQIDALRSSSFVQDVPTITLGISEATPFGSNDFFDILFEDGPAGSSLTRLTIDLSPVDAFFDPTGASPGLSASSLGIGTLDGLTLDDIGVSGMIDGSQFLTLDFAAGTFGVGDHIAFGSDIDLFSATDVFGATPEQLVGALFTFDFDFGLSLTAELGSGLLADALSVISVGTVVPLPNPLDPQVPSSQVIATGRVENMASVSSVPLPASGWFLLAGMAGIGLGLRRRRAGA